MISRILLAVEDSPGSLRAARLAIEIATSCGATVRLVTVADGMMADENVAVHLGAGAEADRARAADRVLAHVATLATGESVPVECRRLDGEPAPRILDQAREWPADLIVMGRARQPGTGRPYVGSQTRAVLEFADAPVLVVPHTWRA